MVTPVAKAPRAVRKARVSGGAVGTFKVCQKVNKLRFILQTLGPMSEFLEWQGLEL